LLSQGHGGTRFTKDFAKGSVLVIKRGGVKATAKVAQVCLFANAEYRLTTPPKRVLDWQIQSHS
jgi:hypothetical protein